MTKFSKMVLKNLVILWGLVALGYLLPTSWVEGYIILVAASAFVVFSTFMASL